MTSLNSIGSVSRASSKDSQLSERSAHDTFSMENDRLTFECDESSADEEFEYIHGRRNSAISRKNHKNVISHQGQNLTNKIPELVDDNQITITKNTSSAMNPFGFGSTQPIQRSTSESNNLSPSIRSLLSCPNTIADQLRELQSLNLSNSTLAEQILESVAKLRSDTLNQMPKRIRDRSDLSALFTAPTISYESEGFTPSEFTLLLGRCFNLSLNLKILVQCNFADPVIGSRVFADLKTIEDSLRQLVRQDETSRTLSALTL